MHRLTRHALFWPAVTLLLLLIVSAENRIRLLPPLVITAAEADLLVEKISGLVRAFLTAGAAA